MNRHCPVPPSVWLGLAAALLATQAGCSNEAHCYDCDDGDHGADGGQVDAAGGSGGSFAFDAPFGDGFTIDSNDCNADLTRDSLNCGVCGHVCEIQNAFAKCQDSFCIIDRCASGYYDLDGQLANGCEYECEPLRDEDGNPFSEEQVCDGDDDDCDGVVDEVFDFDNSLTHCGGCNIACAAPPNSVMDCTARECVFDRCLDSFEDANKDVNPQSVADGTTDGCECNRIGLEQCNLIDDDCDGEVDEDIDVTSDQDNCGACGNACGAIFSNAVTKCQSSTCVFGGCLPGFHNIDGVQANGCEYHCSPANPPTETCNGQDDNCNGFVDDGTLPNVGATCGSSTGECET
ncbi:MAG: hypothetical protein MUF54_13300, partial [Polyangiaceae bacterium]|nr:hypothetical protein [Polyangiaceae bacterium]